MLQKSQIIVKRFIKCVDDAVILPVDDDLTRIRKLCIAQAQIIGIIFILVWGSAFVILNYWQAAVINLAFSMLVAVNLILFMLNKNLFICVNTCLSFLLLWTFVLQSSLGGIFKSGLISIWAAFCPLSASVLLSQRNAIIWLVLFIAEMGVSAAFEQEFAQRAPHIISPMFSIMNSVMNIISFTVLLVGANLYLVSRLEEARERADHLLLNILPAPIAGRLKRQPGIIADAYPQVTVLFADIVGFTQLSEAADPADIVNLLNAIFTEFDELTTKHGLEKIKTIGDAYMVVGGLPISRTDHAEAVAAMALDMLNVVKNYRSWNDEPIRLRVGINTGPVVAGVIGRRKFVYDLWGDAVNTASRMESNGMPNTIQVTKSTYYKLQGRYHFEEREPIHVKGKGQMVTYLLKGRIDSTGLN